MADNQQGGGESTLTVLLALSANAGIAIAKGVAAVLSGSAAMAAETAHSVADTANELFLLAALRRSEKPADRTHPFGYGKERFFWSLIAAISIFASGAVFSFAEGIRALLAGEGEATSPTLSYIVLAVSFVLEGTSWQQAARQVRREARDEELTVREFLRRTDDPTAKTVFYEDSAALIGLLLAFGGVWLHATTGSAVGDAVASLLIGGVLSWVAWQLASTNKHLLIGSQADPRLVRAIGQWLRDAPEIESVVDLVTMRVGTDRALVCARVDLVDDIASGDIELAMVRLDEGLRAEFTDVDEVFLQPVPQQNERARQRVVDRYGQESAEHLTGGAPSEAGPGTA